VVKINISQLGEGHYHIQQKVDPVDVFLDGNDQFNQSIQLDFNIEKIGRNIVFNIAFKTNVDMICDRCAEPYLQNISDSLKILYTYDHELEGQEEDDVYVINEATSFVDVAEPLRQTLLLSLPLKHLCHVDCKGLCPHCGANLNDSQCTCEQDQIDPRWEKLKILLEPENTKS